MPAIQGLPELEHALCAFDNEHIVGPGGFKNGNDRYVGSGRPPVARPPRYMARENSMLACHPLVVAQVIY
jgi:hypothetical protein